MEFKNVIHDRYSVRHFSKKPVEKEKLDAVLEAGRLAPTAGNRQPQRILIVQDPAALEKIYTCTPCHFGAPVVLLVCYERIENPGQGEWHNGDFGRVDASIVMTHMMLQAQDLNLGSCWVGLYKESLLREKFQIPEQYAVVSLMLIGYPAGDAVPANMHTERVPIEQTVQYNSFAART